MAFRIRISPRAKLDLESIFLWIQAPKSATARKWYQGLKEAIRDLAVNPERCPITPEDRVFRHLLYGKGTDVYRIIFRLIDKPRAVEIVHIRHGARQPFTPADLN